MTVLLTYRLLESKVLPRVDVAMALRDSCMRGVAMVQALLERNPGAQALLNREFSRWNGPTLSTLAVDVELVQKLPLGMCERLLALPLLRAQPNAPVPLAVVDPFDTHVFAEFRYCLGLAVTPLCASFALVVEGLETVRGLGQASNDVLLDERDNETPAFGAKLLRSTQRHRRTREYLDGPPQSKRGFTLPPLESPVEPSEPPLPLVHTTMAPGPFAATIQGAPKPPAYAAQGSVNRDSEPVLKLVKQKPSMSFRLSVPPPLRAVTGANESPEVTLAGLSEAQTPQQLLARLQVALRLTAPCQAVFAVRGNHFVLKWSKASVPPAFFALTEEQQNVLITACQAGYFLGPLPPDGQTQALGLALGMRAREEIYVVPVNVANRAALVIVLGHFDDAFAVTRWVDALVTRAGQVLERLARAAHNRA